MIDLPKDIEDNIAKLKAWREDDSIVLTDNQIIDLANPVVIHLTQRFGPEEAMRILRECKCDRGSLYKIVLERRK